MNGKSGNGKKNNVGISSYTRNEEEDDHFEKVEKGTKVKRTLSSLRNRVTGSFSKDKVNTHHRQMV